MLLECNIDLLREYLNYDPVIGDLFWIKKPSYKILVGDKAGCVNGWGYSQVRFKGVIYRSHRIIWALQTGEWPKDLIDHIDGNKLNNKIENLRLCNQSENLFNASKRSGVSSVYKGVSNHKHEGLWKAYSGVTGSAKHLGIFNSEEEAARAYDKFARENYGEFAKLNFK